LSSSTYSGEIKRPVSYILLLHCRETVKLSVGGLGTQTFVEGVYAYIGSANIKDPVKRILRHFSREKRIRWHVDYLTLKCRPLKAAVFFGFSEEELYDTIIKKLAKHFTPYIAGFGSSDKPHHYTHLFILRTSPDDALNRVVATVKQRKTVLNWLIIKG